MRGAIFWPCLHAGASARGARRLRRTLLNPEPNSAAIGDIASLASDRTTHPTIGPNFPTIGASDLTDDRSVSRLGSFLDGVEKDEPGLGTASIAR